MIKTANDFNAWLKTAKKNDTETYHIGLLARDRMGEDAKRLNRLAVAVYNATSKGIVSASQKKLKDTERKERVRFGSNFSERVVSVCDFAYKVTKT